MDCIYLFVLFMFPSTLLTLVIPAWTVSADLFMFLFQHGPYLLICFVYVPIHSTDTGYSHMDRICLFVYVPIHSTDTGYSHMDRICLFVLFMFPSTLQTLVTPTWTVSAYLVMFPPTLPTLVSPTWTVSAYLFWLCSHPLY